MSEHEREHEPDATPEELPRPSHGGGNAPGEVADDTRQLDEVLTSHHRLALRAAEAEEARDEFLSRASHELRTPLATLRIDVEGLVRVLQREAPGVVAANVRRIARVGAQLARLDHVVQHMLDFARLSARVELELHLEDVELVELVRACAARHAAATSAVIEVDAAGEVMGRCDRKRIEHVITALLTNAIRHGHGKPVAISLEAQPQWVHVCVRDEGSGIPAEAQDRIFHRLKRGGSSGLGLGLWISRAVAEAHGGSLSVSSSPGIGSTFTLTLPRVAS